jgi:hypothetical protein
MPTTPIPPSATPLRMTFGVAKPFAGTPPAGTALDLDRLRPLRLPHHRRLLQSHRTSGFDPTTADGSNRAALAPTDDLAPTPITRPWAPTPPPTNRAVPIARRCELLGCAHYTNTALRNAFAHDIWGGKAFCGCIGTNAHHAAGILQLLPSQISRQ